MHLAKRLSVLGLREPERRACENCGVELQGPFCHACGQPRESPLVSLRAFVAHVAADLVGFDTRLIRTLRALATQPGELTRAYLSGRRVAYMQPLQVYLACAAAYFVLSAFNPVLRFNVEHHYIVGRVGWTTYSTGVPGAKLAVLARRGIAAAAIQGRIEHAVGGLLPAFLATSLLMLTAVLGVLYAPSRRRVLEHAVFALHWAAVYLLVMAAWLLILPALEAIPDRRWAVPPVAALLIGALLYLAVALHRVYGGHWALNLLRAPILFFAFILAQLAWLHAAVWLAITRLG